MRHLMFLLLLTSHVLWAATVWRWRDADGVVHYSDQPVPGAEQITSTTSNSFTPITNPVTSTASSSAASATVRYRSLVIAQPANQATIANTGGTVSVALQLEPELANGHQIKLMLDGRVVAGYPPQALSFQLTEVARGEHTLQASVTDARGNALLSSAAVTFYVQQPSVLRNR